MMKCFAGPKTQFKTIRQNISRQHPTVPKIKILSKLLAEIPAKMITGFKLLIAICYEVNCKEAKLNSTRKILFAVQDVSSVCCKNYS